MELRLAIPARNAARYLPATLASLREQAGLVHWWLQDAESTDATATLAREHQQPGDVVRIEADQGQADALNRAFEQMGGDIVGFINADDCLTPGAAGHVLDFFAAHPEVDLVYGEIEFIDTDGTVTGAHAGRIDSLDDILDIYHCWWKGKQWVQPEVFFRRTLWERVGRFDASYHLAFDYEFWVRCFLAGARVARLPRVLAQFRLHPAQKSRAAAEAAREIRLAVERHLPAAGLPPAFARRLRAQIDYDRYHLGEGAYGKTKPGFPRYLLTHPQAWRLAAVHRRLAAAVSHRLGLPRK